MTNQQKHSHGGKRANAGRPSRAPISKRVNFKASTVQWLAATGSLGPEVRRIIEAVQEASEAAQQDISYNDYVRIGVTLLRAVLNDEEETYDGK